MQKWPVTVRNCTHHHQGFWTVAWATCSHTSGARNWSNLQTCDVATMWHDLYIFVTWPSLSLTLSLALPLPFFLSLSLSLFLFLFLFEAFSLSPSLSFSISLSLSLSLSFFPSLSLSHSLWLSFSFDTNCYWNNNEGYKQYRWSFQVVVSE